MFFLNDTGQLNTGTTYYEIQARLSLNTHKTCINIKRLNKRKNAFLYVPPVLHMYTKLGLKILKRLTF